MEESEKMLGAYENDSAVERTIRDSITGAYGNLRPEIETVRKYETEQLPAFYNAYSGYGMGTGAADLDPLARMQAASGDVARKSALGRTARDIFDVSKAGMEDLIGEGMRQWERGYGMAQNKWGRDFEGKEFDEGVRQFDVGQEFLNKQFNQSVKEFGMNYAMQEKQYNQSVLEFNQTMAQKDRDIEIARQQFEQSHGLEKQKHALNLQQLEESKRQFEVSEKNALKMHKDNLEASKAASARANSGYAGASGLDDFISTFLGGGKTGGTIGQDYLKNVHLNSRTGIEPLTGGTIYGTTDPNTGKIVRWVIDKNGNKITL